MNKWKWKWRNRTKMKNWKLQNTSPHLLMIGRSISSPTSSSSLSPSMSGRCTSAITRSNLSMFSRNIVNAVIASLVVVTAIPKSRINKIDIIQNKQSSLCKYIQDHNRKQLWNTWSIIKIGHKDKVHHHHHH